MEPGTVSDGRTEDIGPKAHWSLMPVSLRYRDFRLVWLGSISEHFGEFMEIAAILWLVNEMTHSPLMLTIVGACRFATMVFFPIAGGVVADRVNRRSLLIVALLASVSLSVGLAALTATGLIAVWHLIVISLLGGVAMSFNHPARQSIVPNLVNREHLLNAISIDILSVRASNAIGMPVAGYLLAIVGVWPIFALRALGCVIAIALLLLAKVPPTPLTSRTQAPWHNLTQGFRYLRGNTVILILVLLFAVPYLAQNSYMNFLPVFATNILLVGAVGYGWLQGAPGVGSMLCLIGLSLLPYYRNKFRLLIISGALMGISLIIFSTSEEFFLSIPLLVVIGGANAALVALNSTLVQSTIPDEVRGRVLSLREIFFGLGPTGSILFGAIAQYTGVPFSLGLLGGICLILSILLILLLPKFRSVE